MFWFTIKPSSGSHSQYLAKITHSVQCQYMEVVQTLCTQASQVILCNR